MPSTRQALVNLLTALGGEAPEDGVPTASVIQAIAVANGYTEPEPEVEPEPVEPEPEPEPQEPGE